MLNPNAWFQAHFAPNVTHRFNNTGYDLKAATTQGEHLGADRYRFYLQIGGEAQLRSGSGKYSYLSNQNSSVDVSALTYDYAVKVRDDDIRRMSVRAVDAQAKSAATGCAKRANRVVIDALHALPFAGGVNVTGALTDEFRIGHMIGIKERMDALGVPDDGNRFCAMRSNWFNIATLAEVFSNSQYVGPAMPLIKTGMAKTWNGIHWLAFPDDLMPTTGSAFGASRPNVNVEGYGYAWHKDAVGSATIDNGQLRTEMKPISDEPAVSLVTEFDFAVAALQVEGIFRLQAKSVSALPTSSATIA